MFIKEQRIKIDSFIKSTSLLNSSREVALCHTNLQRSFHWLGQSLAELGEQTPYVDSENPANATIEPTANTAEKNLADEFKEIEQTQTAYVKHFRHLMSNVIKDLRTEVYAPWPVEAIKEGVNFEAYKECVKQSWLAFKEAKMWLGWELARIKSQKEIEGLPQSNAAQPKAFLPL